MGPRGCGGEWGPSPPFIIRPLRRAAPRRQRRPSVYWPGVDVDRRRAPLRPPKPTPPLGHPDATKSADGECGALALLCRGGCHFAPVGAASPPPAELCGGATRTVLTGPALSEDQARRAGLRELTYVSDLQFVSDPSPAGPVWSAHWHKAAPPGFPRRWGPARWVRGGFREIDPSPPTRAAFACPRRAQTRHHGRRIVFASRSTTHAQAGRASHGPAGPSSVAATGNLPRFGVAAGSALTGSVSGVRVRETSIS
jgi:hypothetical protein